MFKTGVLVVNLGTPEAPTRSAVRRYLREFLSDHRVIEIPQFIWLPLLHAIILPFRATKSARKYAKIWTAEGSPLQVHTARLAKLLKGYLGERTSTPLEVAYAMRYGSPSVDSILARMLKQGCQRIVVCPLYPQYAASSTASVFDAVTLALQRVRDLPALHFIKSYHDQPLYISALVQSVRDYWQVHGRPQKLLISFHGVPKRTVKLGDPYQTQCEQTGTALAAALSLAPEQYQLSYQSRFGRASWLEPATVALLETWGKEKLNRVDVICPGFVSDCLETLEEIEIEGRAVFLRAGGAELHYIPALNERDDWIKALCAIVLAASPSWLAPR